MAWGLEVFVGAVGQAATPVVWAQLEGAQAPAPVLAQQAVSQRAVLHQRPFPESPKRGEVQCPWFQSRA